MDKYEYLTGEGLGLKPSSTEQTKFEYSPLGKTFNMGLDKEEDKKERLFKRLKYIKNGQKGLINGDNKNEDKKTTKQQHRHKTTKCLWLFKKFKSKGKRFDGWNIRCREWHWQK